MSETASPPISLSNRNTTSDEASTVASTMILIVSALIPFITASSSLHFLSQSHTLWSKYHPLAMHAVLLITLALACSQTLLPRTWRHPAGVLVHAIIWHGVTIYYYFIDVFPALLP
ncbi:hypothetical protein BDR07DRAFT_1391001, partial [Suillus spraguei]